MVTEKEFQEAVEFEKLEEKANDITNKILFDDEEFKEPNGDIDPHLVYDYIIKELIKVKNNKL